MTVADLYGRKSNEDEGRSVAGQEAEYRADCLAEGLTVGRVFADPDRSASRYARKPRPDYLALLEHIRLGKCELLSMWEASRGSRDLGDWVALLDLCRKQGVLIRVISHGRTYDVRVRRDWRTLADEGVDSADESEKISERVRRGKRQSAIAGLPTARLAFGFKRVYDDRGKYVEQIAHPDQAPIVEEIITGIAGGRSAGSIARDLNERGITAPLGGKWKDAQVRTIAIKPSYAALRVHQGQVIGEGKWSPLVDPHVWRKAYAILSTPGRKAVADSTLVHWLTGAVKCGLCGGLMGSRRRAGDRLAYCCRECLSSSSSARSLEGFLEPLIVGRLSMPNATALFLTPADDAAVDTARAELERLQQRLAEFHAEGAKLDGLSAAAIAEAERGLTPRIEAARTKLRKLTVPPALAELDGVDVAAEWVRFPARIKRDLTLAVADIVLAPGDKSGRKTFDEWRVAGSRWVGDDKTWGEHWASSIGS